MAEPTERNRLEGEASPYLRQHADNPVNWQPWDDEAFTRAREHDVPVFVSIGYSSCHWCHVMAEESFADDTIATVLNESFVPIKVDREERPDVDSTFMTVCQLVTGGGGWPLSAWCTPDGRPFYIGTYFPPESRGRHPGFRDLCTQIADSWADPEQRAEMERRATQWADSARSELESVAEPDVTEPDATEPDATEPNALEPDTTGPDATDSTLPDGTLVTNAATTALRAYDDTYGGFGTTGPKFPMPGRIDLLLRAAQRTGREAFATAATGTLTGMASGGMYDQIGGGFHRYAVDRDWSIPHFEKMLYDNAELPMASLDAATLTGDPSYTRVAAETLAFLDRELRHDEGGFFSTLDARSVPPTSRDHGSDPIEGAFYVWTPAEVDAVLDEPTASIVKRRYGIQSGGNFQRGTSVPTIATSLATLTDEFDMDRAALRDCIQQARVDLYEAREERPRPARDEKVLAAWNGRAISAFAAASGSLGAPYATIATEALLFVREQLYDDSQGVLHRRWLDGDVGGPGFLDDYAFMARAALDVYAATGDLEPLAFALELAAQLVAEFYDPADETIYFTRNRAANTTAPTADVQADNTGSASTGSASTGSASTGSASIGESAGRTSSEDHLFARPQEFTDRSTPSSLGVAVDTLAMLDGFRTDDRFWTIARSVLSTHAARIQASPLEHASLVRAADRLDSGGVELTIAADSIPPSWRDTIGSTYLPGAIIARRPRTAEELSGWLDRLDLEGTPPIWADRNAIDDEPTVYACTGFTCSAPTTDIEEALDWIRDRRDGGV